MIRLRCRVQGDIYEYVPGEPLRCIEGVAPLWDGLRISYIDFLHFTYAD